MRYTINTLGFKLYGLYKFSKLGLFNRKFVILDEVLSHDDIIKKLKNLRFRDNDDVAIRFSKNNLLNLPFFLGSFSLKKIADIIEKERKDYVPFVHSLVKTKFAINLYYDGNRFIIEVWPGIGASKLKVFNENPDMIKIDSKITTARYLRDRIVEDVNGEEYVSQPFDQMFLFDLGKIIKGLTKNFDKLLAVANPLLCDAYCESLRDINFTAIQKTDPLNLDIKFNDLLEDYYLAQNIEDLTKYDGSKKLFLDVYLNRSYQDWPKLLGLLKQVKEVYVRSLTMHLSIVLREQGICVKKAIMNKDYELREFRIK